jgi:palmitoyl-protein thioesterase
MIGHILFPLLYIMFAIAGSVFHRCRAENMPIVLVHGIIANSHNMEPLKKHIEEALPGTYVKCVDIGEGKWSSVSNMHAQGKYLCAEIQKDLKLHNGFIMICHSQGGLLGRYYVERWNNPKVHTYISLGSPQRGVFGLPGTYDERFTWLNIFENLARFILYRGFIQEHVSFAEYWHDSQHEDLYLKRCTFLPYLNNEVEHDFSAHYKANICSLHNMVLVESMCDTVIEPVDSCQFGFYKAGTKGVDQSLYEWDVYSQDKLGLKTLDDSGRLHLYWAMCSHTDFQEDKDNFMQNILPFIKVPAECPDIPATVEVPS